MKSKQNTKKQSPPAANAETQWVAVEEGAASAQATIDEHTPADAADSAEFDVAQHAPDEVVWRAVEAEDAAEGPSAKPTAKARKGAPRAKAGAPRGAPVAEAADAENADAKAANASERGEQAVECAADLPHAPAAAFEATTQQEPAVTMPAPVEGDADATTASQPNSSTPSMEEYLAELGSLSVAELIKRHVEVVGRKPKIKSRPWLVRKLGWLEQTRRFGGLSGAAKKRLDELMSEIELPLAIARTPKPEGAASRNADDLPLGTRLERTWHGRVIVATRVEGGWTCEGHSFKSLSAAAKAVSGSHVSGPAWFGVWQPRKDGAQ